MARILQNTYRTVQIWDKDGEDFIAVADNHLSDNHLTLSDWELASVFSSTFKTNVTVETKHLTTVHI